MPEAYTKKNRGAVRKKCQYCGCERYTPCGCIGQARATAGALGRSVNSQAQQDAARINGKKGGRPCKSKQ